MIEPVEEWMQRTLIRQNAVVFDIGANAGEWMESVGRVAPTAKRHLWKHLPASTLDDFCASVGVTRIDYLKLDVDGHALDIIQGAERMLRSRDVDLVQFVCRGKDRDTKTRLADVLTKVSAYAYLVFRAVAPGDLRSVPSCESALEAPEDAHFLAAAPRFRHRMLGLRPDPIDYDALFQSHGIEPRGVIVVGAHEGDDFLAYARAGCRELVLIEGDPETYRRLHARLATVARVRCIEQLVAERLGPVDFHRMTYSQSSSMLPLKRHKDIYPSIQEQETVELAADTLEGVLQRHTLDADRFNVLVVDVQGAELAVLRGSGQVLQRAEAILTKVHYDELYEGCALLSDIDAYLQARAFVRVEENCPYDLTWGYAFYVRRRRLSMRTLGSNGRFGNQLFQYFFLRRFAHQLDAVVEAPPWVGQQLFALPEDTGISAEHPVVHQDSANPDPASLLRRLSEQWHGDLCGYFQYRTDLYAGDKSLFRQMFAPRFELKHRLDDALARLCAGHGTLVALHLRRGDYLGEEGPAFFPAPTGWYVAALKELWPMLRNPLLYVASDDLGSVYQDFADFAPTCAADLGVDVPWADFYRDFYVLSRANVLAISNSSFSFAAAMLNEAAVTFLRPAPNLKKLISFDPWDSDVLLLGHPAE